VVPRLTPASTTAATAVESDGVGPPSRPNDAVSADAAAEIRADAERSDPLVVSAAFAAVQLRARSPPAKRVPSSPLRMVELMVISPEKVELGVLVSNPNGRVLPERADVPQLVRRRTGVE
jgi:hypothetical protein